MICVIGVEEYTGAHNVGADVRFINFIIYFNDFTGQIIFYERNV